MQNRTQQLKKSREQRKRPKEKQGVNIKLDKELHAKAKIISVLKGINMNEYLAKAIAREVEKDKSVLAKIKG